MTADRIEFHVDRYRHTVFVQLYFVPGARLSEMRGRANHQWVPPVDFDSTLTLL